MTTPKYMVRSGRSRMTFGRQEDSGNRTRIRACENSESLDIAVLFEIAERNEKAGQPSCGSRRRTRNAVPIDLSVWENAPKERTAAYFPTYSVVSKAMQTAMRGWVREWFTSNQDVLLAQSRLTRFWYIVHPSILRPTHQHVHLRHSTDGSFGSGIRFCSCALGT